MTPQQLGADMSLIVIGALALVLTFRTFARWVSVVIVGA